MTFEELQAMSDIELDELVAVTVMGWNEITKQHNSYVLSEDTENAVVFMPTENMNDAWMIVQTMLKDDYGFSLEKVDEDWQAWFIEPFNNRWNDIGPVEASTPNRAIIFSAILSQQS
jgi:hypothetical protein